MVAVAYGRWSFTTGSNCKALTGENFGVLGWWSLMGGSRLREVVAHGGLTVAYEINVQGWKKRLGLEGVGGGAGEGGGGAFKKLLLQSGGRGYNFHVSFFGVGWGGGGKVLIRHTFLKNPTVSRIFQEASHLASN